MLQCRHLSKYLNVILLFLCVISFPTDKNTETVFFIIFPNYDSHAMEIPPPQHLNKLSASLLGEAICVHTQKRIAHVGSAAAAAEEASRLFSQCVSIQRHHRSDDSAKHITALLSAVASQLMAPYWQTVSRS